jgi:hypothetical protein
LLAEIVGTARDPLMVAINIAADETKPDALRLEAALGAVRFLHPTLSAAAITHVPTAPSDEAVRTRLADRLTRLGGWGLSHSCPIEATAEPVSATPFENPAQEQ